MSHACMCKLLPEVLCRSDSICNFYDWCVGHIACVSFQSTNIIISNWMTMLAYVNIKYINIMRMCFSVTLTRNVAFAVKNSSKETIVLYQE